MPDELCSRGRRTNKMKLFRENTYSDRDITTIGATLTGKSKSIYMGQ
jgi:hypothetical protein